MAWVDRCGAAACRNADDWNGGETRRNSKIEALFEKDRSADFDGTSITGRSIAPLGPVPERRSSRGTPLSAAYGETTRASTTIEARVEGPRSGVLQWVRLHLGKPFRNRVAPIRSLALGGAVLARSAGFRAAHSSERRQNTTVRRTGTREM